MTHYLTIEQNGTAEYKDRGSKFIGYVYPLSKQELFKPIIQQLKKEHPKAVHFCFAYKIGNAGHVFRSSDDGEPAGTAGKQILGRIESKSLTDVLIVVVRYFGGSLLGVPGLINAYKTTASLVLQVTPVVQKPILRLFSVEFDYLNLNDILSILKTNSCVVIEQDVMLFCKIKAGIPVERTEEALFKLRNLSNVQLYELL
jgi:uncharacterized YigZ family protein